MTSIDREVRVYYRAKITRGATGEVEEYLGNNYGEWAIRKYTPDLVLLEERGDKDPLKHFKPLNRTTTNGISE